jgi:uroporphyrinogen decarboxylase
MTSKQRVRTAVSHLVPDKVPANFEAIDSVAERLLKHYGYSDIEQLYQRFDIDIRPVSPKYIGPELKFYHDGSELVRENFWGTLKKRCWTGKDYSWVTCHYPLEDINTLEELDNYQWPSIDWFDFESIKLQCEKYKDRAIIMGHEGPFQHLCSLRSMDKLFVDMALNPEFAEKLYDRAMDFVLEYYEKIFLAADGQIDILRPHDDYGTQISLLFSVEMWKDYFKENTKRLADLAHKHGAFYQQHSCGAIRPLIPEFIECGVDILEPVQKVDGLEPEGLKWDFGDKLSFQGGIDTQGILPFGTSDDVKKETRYYIDTLSTNGGYILMASQKFEGDIPVENIEAMYSVRD